MSDMKEMCTIVHKKDPEERVYLVCFRSFNDHWMICEGRHDAYEFIKECFSFEDSWHVEGETTIMDKVIEDFKKAMEEQQ